MKIKLLAMDVDGTLTDGRIYIGNDGEVMKAFDVKDGLGIVRFRQAGGIPAIITGRRSMITEQRCRELKITELHQNVGDKLGCLKDLGEKYNITAEETAFIGDDLNDLDCMGYAGLSACPADAVQEVKKSADYVCRHDGGRGAVREFLEYIMKVETE
jgi:3-deoxy-D-manno-octulosonate 8-phosphate phosphatase (KDO 8-P phosphatase)